MDEGTPQRIDVIVAGAAYRPTCKRCGWHGVQQPSLGAARETCAKHRAEHAKCVE